MALPSTGPISFSDINVELAVSATTQRSLNDAAVRTLFGVASGSIDMNTGHGKSNSANLTYIISSNTTQRSVNVATLSGYVAGKTNLTITINNGIYVYSTTDSTPALTITGTTSGDTVSLINNGYIMGKGGNGGYRAGSPGYTALSISSNITLTNNGYIAGGGGGGGGFDQGSVAIGLGGGGAGGGLGGFVISATLTTAGYINFSYGSATQANMATYYPGVPYTSSTPGVAGTNGVMKVFSWSQPWGVSGTYYYGGSGSGGHIINGTGGFAGYGSSNAGYGGGTGGGGSGSLATNAGGVGGAGGSDNSAGSDAGTYPGFSFQCGGGGGGGWGAAGGAGKYQGGTWGAGGAGGKAIALNGYSVTYVTQGTIYGAVA